MTHHTPSSPEFWDGSYRNGRAGWDLGGPRPVLRRLLQSGALTPGKMMVLGAGRGHDARMFAAAGFDVTAVDFAPAAIAAMRRLNSPRTPVTVLEADMFHLPADIAGQFDYVLEYTCFCAILPEQRPAYADVVERLLRQDGRYVALAFPIGHHRGGPPFAVLPTFMIAMFRQRGFTLLHREAPPDSIPQRRGIEELLILQKGGANTPPG